MRSKIAQFADKTDATFNSEPPFVFAPAKQGSVVVRCKNWGNADNSIVADVYWGDRKTLGILPNTANMTWTKDASLTTTILATGGVGVDVAGFIKVPQMASKYMMVVFTLAGTAKEVDLVAWFDWQV